MSNLPIQQALKFIDLQIVSFNLTNKKIGDKTITNELNLQIQFNPSNLFKDDLKLENDFALDFLIDLSDVNNNFVIKMQVFAFFSTNFPCDENFLQSDFAKHNAPAIAFPYIRAFISNFTLNSGYNPIILPAFNFQKQNKDNSNQ